MLTFGSQGAAVKQLQRSLNARLDQLKMHSDILTQTNGVFDEQTLLTVKYLQCASGLPVDGRVSDRTQTFIDQGTAGLETLSIGSTGTQVAAVQQALVAAQITVLVDGKYGQFTELGVRRYQQNLGLVSDGIVKLETWEQIVRSRLKSIPCIALLPDPYSASRQ